MRIKDGINVSIGRGKNMSIAKAALIVWFEYDTIFRIPGRPPLFDWGQLDIMHTIVDVAGAKHHGQIL